MRYPCLVPQRLCKTPISIQIDQEGLNEYGEPFSTVTYSGNCNYQDKAKTVLTAEKKADPDYRNSIVSGRYLQETASHFWRRGHCVWHEAPHCGSTKGT